MEEIWFKNKRHLQRKIYVTYRELILLGAQPGLLDNTMYK